MGIRVIGKNDPIAENVVVVRKGPDARKEAFVSPLFPPHILDPVRT